MAWCFSTRASVATVLTTHPRVSRCLGPKPIVMSLSFVQDCWLRFTDCFLSIWNIDVHGPLFVFLYWVIFTHMLSVRHSCFLSCGNGKTNQHVCKDMVCCKTIHDHRLSSIAPLLNADFTVMRDHLLSCNGVHGMYMWNVLCQKQISRAGTSNYIPQLACLYACDTIMGMFILTPYTVIYQRWNEYGFCTKLIFCSIFT